MRSSLEIYDLASGETRIVHQSADLIEAPNWHPFEDWLLFNGDGRLFRIGLDGSDLREIDTDFADQNNNDHGFSPDGQTIALSHRTESGPAVFLVSVDGGAPERLTPKTRSYFHGWSPDGTLLTYCGLRDGRFDIYTMTVGGGDETRLTGLDGAEDGHNDGPDFSADGSRIWFNSDRTGHAQLWSVPASGGPARQETEDDRVNWFPHPSPDGDWVLYLSYPPGTTQHPADLDVELRLMRPDGTGARTLLAFNGGQGTINVPCWAPDGSAFAFMRYERPSS